MKTFREFTTESANERPLDAVRRAGWSEANSGGMSDTTKGIYHTVRSVNVRGDDHRFYITVDRNKPNEYKVSHAISRGYWSDNFYDHPPYRNVHVAVHPTHQAAIDDLMPRVEKAKADKETWLKHVRR